MTISVTIDSNAWNFLFDHQIDLYKELPPQEFSLFITREVEIEIGAIEDAKDASDKQLLIRYIKNTIASRNVRKKAIFCFAEANSLKTGAGFGHGTFQSDDEREFYGLEETKKQIVNKPKKGSGLTANLADASVAVSSLNSVVLTCDRKKGPIKNVTDLGGKVVFLSDNLLETQPLKQAILSC
ncbi:hypothetical protein [Hydrogenovibrio sp. JE_KL2]|uniref:hypothetical protein n=1 Tax=Hydrogenovibrio sp. JE_KL2 TaxID=2651188 RepID=UPI00128B29F2|nr:hypothetical protein [Hydrogenovibrio sp. JE_KL2]MPQ76597.1 hypothetical protein [Hydrogenovibrio sp. JE_KL2]